MEQKSDVSCIDIQISKEEKVLMAGGNNPHLIYELDLSTNILTPYIDDYLTTTCLNIDEFLIHDNNDIWAATCKPSILHFRNGQLLHHFDTDNSVLTKDIINSNAHLLKYKDGIVVVAKNVSYLIAKYTNENWTLLKEFKLDVDDSEKDKYMYLASINPPIIHKDQLFVPTTLAGCRGIQRFDITKNELLGEEDYEVIHDPSFPSQCIDEIYIDEDGKFYISDQHRITSMDCL